MSTRWFRAETPECALWHLAQGATAVAGGTALLSAAFSPTIGSRAVALAWPDDPATIGEVTARRTLAALADDPGAPAALSIAAQSAGNPATRRRATLGGWIALRAYATDVVAPLLALRANVELITGAGRHTMAYDTYLRDSPSTVHLVAGVTFPERPLWSQYSRHALRATPGPLGVGVAAATFADATEIAVSGVGIPAVQLRFPRDLTLGEARDALRSRLSPDDHRAASRQLERIFREL
ncbi:hypothetical protein GCM10009808_24370 [Microbacterium sediminicola]|uniref:Molybdopterin dehydrogenase FAD-binding domain-containing protein n=1 Tax=Microbacterium sediminicola TaxID=415210 RepID=A0ABP4UH35_9MICO